LLSGGGSIAHGQRGGQYGGEDDNDGEEDEEIKEVAATKSALATKSQKHTGTSPNGGGDDRQSVVSVVSSMNVTTKTKSGHLHKHCLIGTCDGKRITGTAWVRHLKDKH
jgi:hypothetical protein